MTDQELQSWLEQLDHTMKPFYDFIDSIDSNDIPLDDTFGWGARLRHMWSVTKDRPCGLLLTGPNGCGKHTAATHMFHILYENYYAILLHGADLCAGGYEAAKARLLRVIRKYGEEENPLCLILEGMEGCDCRQELFSCLGQVLTTAWMKDPALPPLFVILIDSNEADIPSILRSRLRLCRMSLPSASRRRALLSRSVPMLETAVNFDLLVEATGGATYAQLGDLAQNLWSVINCLPADQASFTDEELREFLEDQLPAPKADNALQSLAQSARQLIDQLPELLKQVGTYVPSREPEQTVQHRTGSSLSFDPESGGGLPSRQDIENQPVETLATDLLGAEFMQKLNKQKLVNR